MRSTLLRIGGSPAAVVAVACAVYFGRDLVRVVDAYLAIEPYVPEADVLAAHFYVVGALGARELVAIALVCAFALWLRFGARTPSRVDRAWWAAAGVFAAAHFASFGLSSDEPLASARDVAALLVAWNAAGLVCALLAVAMLAGRAPGWSAIVAARERLGLAAMLSAAAIVLTLTADKALAARESIAELRAIAEDGHVTVFDGDVLAGSWFGWLEGAALFALLLGAVALGGRWAALACATVAGTVAVEVAYRATERPDALATAAGVVAGASGLAALVAFAGIGVIARLPR